MRLGKAVQQAQAGRLAHAPSQVRIEHQALQGIGEHDSRAGLGQTLLNDFEIVLRRPDVTLFECLRPGDVMAVKEVLSESNPRWGSR